MPDIRYTMTDSNGTRIVEVPDFNDYVVGVYSLAQSVINMLFHPDHGNLLGLIKKRVSIDEIPSIILLAVDRVESVMLEEQQGLTLPDDETLLSIQAKSVTMSDSNTRMSIKVAVNNIEGDTALLDI